MGKGASARSGNSRDLRDRRARAKKAPMGLKEMLKERARDLRVKGPVTTAGSQDI